MSERSAPRLTSPEAAVTNETEVDNRQMCPDGCGYEAAHCGCDLPITTTARIQRSLFAELQRELDAARQGEADSERWEKLADAAEALTAAGRQEIARLQVLGDQRIGEQDALIGELARALKAAEWQGEGGFWEARACVECDQSPYAGHVVDCTVRMLLARLCEAGYLKDQP